MGVFTLIVLQRCEHSLLLSCGSWLTEHWLICGPKKNESAGPRPAVQTPSCHSVTSSLVYHPQSFNSPFLCCSSVGEHIRCCGVCWLYTPSASIKNVHRISIKAFFFSSSTVTKMRQNLHLVLSRFGVHNQKYKTGKGTALEYGWSIGCGHAFKNGTRKLYVLHVVVLTTRLTSALNTRGGLTSALPSKYR